MKTLFIIFLTLTTTIITAQNNVSWVGGTPGKETKWDEAKNWSNHRVPDEFSNVTITDVSSTTFSSPVIKNGKVELNELWLDSNAELTIMEGAQLVVYGTVSGVLNENLKINGSLLILDEAGKTTINPTALVGNN